MNYANHSYGMDYQAGEGVFAIDRTPETLHLSHLVWKLP